MQIVSLLHHTILSSVARLVLLCFPTLYHKHYHFLEEKLLNVKCVSRLLSGTFLILIRIQQNLNLHKYACKVPVIRVRF